MPKTLLTKANIQFIKANRLKMSGSAMAKKFGLEKNIVGRYMRKHGLVVSPELKLKFRSQAMIGRTDFTAAEDKFIRDNYLTMPIKPLGDKIGRSYTGVMNRIKVLGLKLPQDIRDQRKKIGQIKKGNVSFNKGKKQTEYMSAQAIARTKKTRFKKGNAPHNTKEKDGVITIRNDRMKSGKLIQYKYIRLSLGVWYPYHQHKWEKKYGKIPASHCLWFKDGNSLNCKLSNLELITRAENMKRNTIQRYPKEVQSSIKLLSKLNNTIKTHEQQTIRPQQQLVRTA